MDALTTFLDATPWEGKLFAGQWKTSADIIDVHEPATGSILTSVAKGTPQIVRECAAEAKSVQASWAAMDFQERSAIFRRAAQLMEKHADTLHQWIVRETGAIMGKAQVELAASIATMWDAAAIASQPCGLILPTRSGRNESYARRVPHGVVGVITPFNFPMILTMQPLGPALAVGNTVIVKPDTQTPMSGGLLLAAILEEAGLPKGVLHVLPGDADVGEALVCDPDVSMISFTGSTNAGRRVGELAGRHVKKVTLELGGKNALIVLEDADLDIAASNAAWGSFLHQGQICIATGCILAHQSIAAELAAKIAEKANHLPVGDPASGQVALGPIINQRQLDKIHSIVTDTVAQGAKLLSGGTYDGLFYRPTVLSGVKPGMRSFDEEIFGPVASIIAFSSDEEAISLANKTEYGLSAGVISGSLARAQAVGNQLHVGMLHINDQTVNDDFCNSFGGCGASGNGGSHGSPSAWEEYTHWQWVSVKHQATPYPF